MFCSVRSQSLNITEASAHNTCATATYHATWHHLNHHHHHLALAHALAHALGDPVQRFENFVIISTVAA